MPHPRPLSRRHCLAWGLGSAWSLAGPTALAAAPSSPVRLHGLDTPDGTHPLAGLVRGADGALYGTTTFNGPGGLGTVYRLDEAGGFSVLHAFVGGAADGAKPYGGLVVGPDGRLWGTTLKGGSADHGTVFALGLDGQYSLMHAFGVSPDDGTGPQFGLALAPDGRLCGSTFGGGVHDRGTLFAITTAGVLSRLHDFDGSLGRSTGALAAGPDGALHGVAYWSGFPRADGVLFRLSRKGSLKVVHAFSFDGTEGGDPRGLVAGSDGGLYGAANIGGDGYGTLYRLTAGGGFETLHRFAAHGRQGLFPAGPLVEGRKGHFYGVARLGGDHHSGTVFHLAPSGKVSTLCHFNPANGVDGRYPVAGLLRGSGGWLYGCTEYGGGSPDAGTVYRVATR